MSEPLIPTTKDQLFYEAILEKLGTIEIGVWEIVKQLEKLNTSPTYKLQIANKPSEPNKFAETDATKHAKSKS